MVKEVPEIKKNKWFPMEVRRAPRSRGKTDPWGRERGLGSPGKGMGEAPAVSLPKDAEGCSGPGVPLRSHSEELSRCCL